MSAAALRDAGRAIGTALGHHLLWLGATVRAERLHFLSREGAWLARHYAALRARRRDGAGWPAPVPLAVSRRSSFLPSLPAVTADGLLPLLAQYRDATGAAVLDSLGLAPPPGLAGLGRRFADPGVAEAILGDPAIAAALARRHAGQRAALLAYLDQQGALAGEALAVADIGWRGSIQDNLARLLPDRRVTGFYLALLPPLAEAPPNAAKRGFLLEPRDPPHLARRLRFVAPLEFAASDETPSVLGYALRDGRAEPLHDALVLVPHASAAFRAFQAAIAEGVTDTAGLRTPDPALARTLLLQVVESPPPALARLFFEAWRDDRFGAGMLRRGAPRLRGADLLRALSGPAARHALGRRLAESGWPWGLLVRDMPRAAPLLRRLILAVDARL